MENHCERFRIRLGSWNVQGLKTKTHEKLDDYCFVNCLKQFDIIGLMETHANEDSNSELDGYVTYQKLRKKIRRAKKCSGGITVFCKK